MCKHIEKWFWVVVARISVALCKQALYRYKQLEPDYPFSSVVWEKFPYAFGSLEIGVSKGTSPRIVRSRVKK